MSERIAPIVIVGGKGMLGRAWRELLDRRGLDYVSLDLPELDITDAASIVRQIAPGTRTVINVAAYTNVDGAEEHEEQARAINATAVGHLAGRCGVIGATLVHYSTDYVFDGEASKPYTVDHPLDPVSAYGRTKAEGERQLQGADCGYLMIRTSWLYAPWANNFVRTIAKLARERESLKVVNDQRGRPTSAEHLAGATLGLLEKGARGVFHVNDGGECTWYEFARAIAGEVNPSCRVEPCRTEEFPRPARRPSYSVLDLAKTEKWLGPMPHWKDNLADVLRRLEPVAT
jgi:dTDP-4-dehydrorhamnose reductase